MLRNFAWSVSSAITLRPNLRFRERGFEVRMWRANACRRATLPVPVFLKRLDAPLCVLSLGMVYCSGIYYLWKFPMGGSPPGRNYSQESSTRRPGGRHFPKLHKSYKANRESLLGWDY
jgi:hypothetical protein